MVQVRRRLVCAAAVGLALASGAHAATIDFSGLGSGDSGQSNLIVGDSTIAIQGGTAFGYSPGDFGAFTDSGGLCALRSGEFSCRSDWTMTFAYEVTNLQFESAFFDGGDSVLVEAFNGATSLGTVLVEADGTFGFGGAVVTSLSFDDSSAVSGFGFGDFRFDRAAVGAPEPGSLALLGLGLAGLAFRQRRRG